MKRRQLLTLPLLAGGPWAHAQGTTASAVTTSSKPDASMFIQRPQMTGALLSPDGLNIAMWVRNLHGRSSLAVINAATLKPTVVFSSKSTDAAGFMWVNAQRLAFTIGNFDWDAPVRDLRAGSGLFVVNPDGSNYRSLLTRREDLRFYGKDSDNHSDCVLMYRVDGFDKGTATYLQLFRVDTTTAKRSQLEVPVRSIDWWHDPQGELRAAWAEYKEQGELLWNDPGTKSWRVLRRFNAVTGDPDFHIRHIAADDTVYVTSRRGGDLRTLWTFNPATGEWGDKPLLSSPYFDIDASVLTRQNQVIGLRFDIDAEVTLWLDPAIKALQAQIDELLPHTTNRLSIPRHGESPWVLVTSFADNHPGIYQLFHRTDKRFVKLGATQPQIDPTRMARMDLVHVKARDGLNIPCWITMPANVEKGKRPPMVVLVHGGPFVEMSTWEFNTEVQFLAARGYVVLQPQFRGTVGLGQKHQLAGWRQWGKAMQTDVTDATRWAVDQGLADPQRIAIAGGSYGGYSALMGLVQEPTLYCCGLAWAAPTDLDMMYSVYWSDLTGTFKKFGLPLIMGDRVKDAEDLKAHSPLTHAQDIKQPLLLVYGERDERVPIVHGEKFKKAVQAVNPHLEWVTYDDEGHGWASPKNQIDFWNRVAAFLDKHTATRG